MFVDHDFLESRAPHLVLIVATSVFFEDVRIVLALAFICILQAVDIAAELASLL